jgi:hypothetical protein
MKKWVFILLLIISIVLIGLGIAGTVVGAHHTVTKGSDQAIHQFYLIAGILALIIGLIMFLYLIYTQVLKKKSTLDKLQPEYFVMDSVSGAYTGNDYGIYMTNIPPASTSLGVTPNINGVSYPVNYTPQIYANNPDLRMRF